MTDQTNPPTPQQADRDLAEKFWRVHPREIQDAGITREEWYAQHIAHHAQQARLEERARCAEIARTYEQTDDADPAFAAGITVASIGIWESIRGEKAHD